MRVREEFAELPLVVQFFLKGFGLGAGLGSIVAIVNILGYARAAEGMRGEVVELGAYWALLLGFPLSLGVAPFLMFGPWVWMVLLPAFNLGLLAVVAFLAYQVIRLVPPFRE